MGSEAQFTGLKTSAPAELLTGSDYVVATIVGDHPDHPGWRRPVQMYFRRGAAGWTPVGIYR